MSSIRTHRIARRALKIAAWILGVTVIGTLTLVALALVAMDLPWVRSFAAEKASAALADTFQGRVRLHRIGGIDLTGVRGVVASVDDAKGKRVLNLNGASVRLFWPGLVWDLVVRKPATQLIRIERIGLDHAEAVLRDDGTGQPTLATAFLPRTPSAPEPDDSGETRVVIERIELGHAWIHGGLPALAVIDAELERVGASFSTDPRVTSFELQIGRLRGRGLPLGVDPSGKLDARGTLPSAPGAAIAAHARYDGSVLGARAAADARIDGKRVLATLKADGVPPAKLAELAPGLAPRAATTLEARVEGTLPELAVDARVANPAARLDLKGRAKLEGTTELHAALEGSNIDLAGLIADGPHSALAFRLEATGELRPDGAASARYTLVAPPSRLAEHELPRVELDGRLKKAADGALDAEGTAVIDEPGAPTRVGYELAAPAGGSPAIEIQSTTKLEQPPRLKALANGLTLGGGFELRARYEPDLDRLDARVNARLRGVAQGETRVGSLGLAGHVQGSARAPRIDAALTAKDIRAAGRKLDTAQVNVQGSLERLRIDAELEGKQPDRIELTTTFVNGAEMRFERPRLTLADEEGKVELGAERVRISPRAVRVESIALSGAGTLGASLVYERELTELDLETKDLDAARLLRLVGAEAPLEAGRFSLIAHYAARSAGERRSAFVRGSARGVHVDTVEDGAIDLNFALEGHKLTGLVEADLGRAARVSLTAIDLALPEPPITRGKLERLTGSLALRANADLERLAPLLRRSGAPIESARGKLDLELRVSRMQLEEQPVVRGHVETEGLDLVGRRETEHEIRTAAQARAAEPWHVYGVDFAVRAKLDQNEQVAEIRAQARDRHGEIVRVEIESPLALPITELPELIRALPRTPLTARVSMPARDLERLPKLIRPKGMQGRLALDVQAEGTLRDPAVRGLVTLTRFRSGDTRRELDLRLNAEYEHLKGKLELDARTPQRQVARLEADWEGNPIALARAEGAAARSPIVANVRAKLDRFPLGAIPALYERQVRGPLTADVSLASFGKNAELRASFDGAGIVAGRVGIQELKGSLRTERERLVGTLRIGGNRGYAQADFSTGLRWADRLTPEIDPNPEAKLVARDFRVETFMPLVEGQLSELAGRLSADLQARFERGTPRVDGTLTYARGVIQVPSIGQRFHGIEARVAIHEGQVRLERFEARGVSGRVTGNASAELAGLELRSADGHLRIKESEKLPLTVEGVSIGDAWGRVDVAYRHHPDRNRLRVEIPDFHVVMPADSNPSVQSLEPADGVRIGVHRKDREFVTLPVQPLEEDGEEEAPSEPSIPTEIEVQLGRSVWLERGPEIKVQLGGEIKVLPGPEQSRVVGRIELRGGTLDVQGKTFQVERGVITLNPADPSNPTITATARWESPGGVNEESITVYAEYSGTAKDGKLVLRTEPPHTQDEILSLIMYGSTEGSFGSSGGNQASSTENDVATAVGVAGGTAVKGLNRVLSNFTNLDVSARLDTSTGSARPEIVIQLSPRLTARITRAIGEPATGQSPDRTFLTLEFRLLRAWSLSTLLGDRGASALDVIWRRQY